jgi:hypothetical protein
MRRRGGQEAGEIMVRIEGNLKRTSRGGNLKRTSRGATCRGQADQGCY